MSLEHQCPGRWWLRKEHWSQVVTALDQFFHMTVTDGNHGLLIMKSGSLNFIFLFNAHCHLLLHTRLYYQHKPSHLSTCPVTIHSLLHIADGIDTCSLVLAYWAFPMEHFCGKLQGCIKSCQYPYTNLDTYIFSDAQLSIIKNKYNLHKTLIFRPSTGLKRSHSLLSCKCFNIVKNLSTKGVVGSDSRTNHWNFFFGLLGTPLPPLPS